MKMLKLIILISIPLIVTIPLWGQVPSSEKAKPSDVFRFHLASEPVSLDSNAQKGRTPSFLANALHRPLFQSSFEKTFEAGTLKHCRWKTKMQMLCDLTPSLFWSNGQPITSADVVRAFTHFKKAPPTSITFELVSNIKTVSAPNTKQVLFELVKEDIRFQEQLTIPYFHPIYSEDFPSPEKASELVSSGPYQIEEWEIKKRIRLKPNPYFKGGHPHRPKVEFLFIPDDNTALVLYQNNQLDFLRRLPTALIEAFKNTPDFHQAPMARIDYVGFGPELAAHADLRYHLSHSLDFDEWAMVLHARGRPGCFGIGKDLLKADPCLNPEPQNYAKWKQHWATHPYPRLTLYYSTQGGDDHKRSMEWLQQQWRNNLGLEVAVVGKENSIFQKTIIENPPTIFRYGVALNHMSCANGVTNMMGLPELKLPFQTPEIMILADRIAHSATTKNTEPLCKEFLETLLKQNHLIPLGRIQFSFLAKPDWEGWRWYPMNYVDISQLHLKNKGAH